MPRKASHHLSFRCELPGGGQGTASIHDHRFFDDFLREKFLSFVQIKNLICENRARLPL